jgi:hypothetical protein
MFSRILGWSILASCTVFSANSSILLTVNQAGPDVVLSGSGTADLAGLVINQSGGCQSVLNHLWIQVGALGSCTLYGNMSGPTSLPVTIGTLNVPLGSGDIVGILNASGSFLLGVPSGYVSGSLLAGAATFPGTTLSAIGATPGTYVWTWGSGATADSLTLQVGAAAPEPSTILTLGGALLGIMVYMVYTRSTARRKN